jgi:Tfp pilus assembly protein FimV
MMRKNYVAGFVMAVALSLSLTACKDTKTLQENEQLKAQVAELQKANAQLGNRLDAATASGAALAKENDALKSEMKALKAKHPAAKTSKRKHRRSRTSPRS